MRRRACPPALRSAPMRDLRSAELPAPGSEDHVRGPPKARLVIMYADFTCPHCAVAHERLRELPVRRLFRHFALAARHPRAPALACAAEAAAQQGRFWEMHDSLFAGAGRIDDPHLWARARELGLDLERFERDRRAPATLARVRRDVDAGLRAGISSTPTLVVDGRLHAGAPQGALLAALQEGNPLPAEPGAGAAVR